ncbi:hypothetical protein ZIOFF_051766 [Zingiber officinale]|uniref:Uncharacterized protein n=1 Tax=Zingiber officinale TaxID=94328 RepID=A0A8J5FMG6_ZINOF|nr:hypothetical protein ZIOFF_051766 [Zingiber officinale]
MNTILSMTKAWSPTMVANRQPTMAVAGSFRCQTPMVCGPTLSLVCATRRKRKRVFVGLWRIIGHKPVAEIARCRRRHIDPSPPKASVDRIERGGVACWVSGAGVFVGGEALRESAEEDRSEGDGLVAQGGGIAGEARLGCRCIPIQVQQRRSDLTNVSVVSTNFRNILIISGILCNLNVTVIEQGVIRFLCMMIFLREFILVLSEASGILNLHNDVQMCGYQDVQTMWELVKRSEMELSHKNKKRKRPLWRLSAWLNRTSCSDPMDPH